MTPEAKLREMLAAATRGPWRHGTFERYHVFVPHGDGYGPERVLLRMNTFFPHEADAALIVAAVNVLPHLLDVVGALERASRDLHAAADGAPLASSRLAWYQAENALTALRAALAGDGG
jgi:hypothetical protein